MDTLIPIQTKINNVLGMIEEFLENYPIWDEIGVFEQLDFDTEWCNAIGQYEFLEKENLAEDQQQQLKWIKQKMYELKPKLLEFNLLLPKGF